MADDGIASVRATLRSGSRQACVATRPAGAAAAPQRLLDRQRRRTRRSARRPLLIGFDIEVAERVGEDLNRAWGDLSTPKVSSWRYDGTNWLAIPEHELRRAVYGYDGADFTTPVGKPAAVKLSKSRVDSVLNELAAKIAQPSASSRTTRSASTALRASFVSRGRTPSPSRMLPDHRCRHTLPGRWSPGGSGSPPAGSLLGRLLAGVFQGDDAAAKIDLLAEIVGAAALGYGTRLRQPRAVILKEKPPRTARARSSISPAGCCRPPPSALLPPDVLATSGTS